MIHRLAQQSILLRRNAPHFVQYVLARYFSSESGSEQLSWMLPNFSASKVDQTCLKRYSFDDLNELVDLTPKSSLVELYDLMNHRVGDTARAAGILPEDNCVGALACLYSSNSFSSLNEPDKVQVRCSLLVHQITSRGEPAKPSSSDVKDCTASKRKATVAIYGGAPSYCFSLKLLAC